MLQFGLTAYGFTESEFGPAQRLAQLDMLLLARPGLPASDRERAGDAGRKLAQSGEVSRILAAYAPR